MTSSPPTRLNRHAARKKVRAHTLATHEMDFLSPERPLMDTIIGGNCLEVLCMHDAHRGVAAFCNSLDPKRVKLNFQSAYIIAHRCFIVFLSKVSVQKSRSFRMHACGLCKPSSREETESSANMRICERRESSFLSRDKRTFCTNRARRAHPLDANKSRCYNIQIASV